MCEETRRFSQRFAFCIQINMYRCRFVNYITNTINSINIIINIIFFTHSTQKPWFYHGRVLINSISHSVTCRRDGRANTSSTPRGYLFIAVRRNYYRFGTRQCTGMRLTRRRITSSKFAYSGGREGDKKRNESKEKKPSPSPSPAVRFVDEYFRPRHEVGRPGAIVR